MRAAALVLCLLAAGCSSVDARVNLRNRRILLVPFAEGAAAEFDSKAGRELVEAIETELAGRLPRGAEIVDHKAAERLLPVPRRAVDWTAVARTLKADVILLGNIRENRLRDPKTLGLLRGTLKVEYRVVDARRETLLLSVPSRTFQFPPDRSGTDPAFNFGAEAFEDPERIARGLLAEAAAGIAEDFYDHEAHP